MSRINQMKEQENILCGRRLIFLYIYIIAIVFSGREFRAMKQKIRTNANEE